MSYSQPLENTPLDSGRRPTVALGWSASFLGSLSGLSFVAEETQLYSADLDLRKSFIAPRSHSFNADLSTLRLRNLWLPGSIEGPGANRRLSRLESFVEGCLASNGLRSIVVPCSNPARTEQAVTPLIRKLIESQPVKLSYALEASSLSREPRHLQHLTTVKHIAEEWDLGLALDLTGPIYPGWEAEAVVMRILPRLVAVRLPVDVSQRTYAGRTLAMLADQGYTGIISAVADTSIMATLLRPQTRLLDVFSMQTTILAEYERRRGQVIPIIERSDLSAFDRP